MTDVREIHVSLLLEPPLPIRATMDEDKLRELADSIRRHGVLQNLVVVPANGKFEIVAGHRRYMAAVLAGLETLPCKVYDKLEDAKYGAMLDENMLREELTAAEEGIIFLELAEKRGWGIEQLRQYFGRSEEYINQRARLVRDFPELMKKVCAREVTWPQAKIIMRCKNPQWIPFLIEQAHVHGVTPRTLTNYVEQFRANDLAATGKPAPHTGEGALAQIQPEVKLCPWCGLTTDPYNFVNLPIHAYHLRNLLEFLKATGIGQLASSRQSEPAPDADSAASP